jgi:hypothetical protein
MWDRMLTLHFTWILPSSGLLRSAGYFRTDVSVLPISSIFNGQVSKLLGYLTVPSSRVKCPSFLDIWQSHLQGSSDQASWTTVTSPLKMGPVDSPKTSILEQPTLRRHPEDGRILEVWSLLLVKWRAKVMNAAFWHKIVDFLSSVTWNL